MKENLLNLNKPVLMDNSRVIVDNSLKESYQKDLNSPFIQRKMDQATAFLNEHGLPEGWDEWKKIKINK